MLIHCDKTKLTSERQLRMQSLAGEVSSVAGDVIEVGVWKGGSAKLLCRLFPERTIHLFDTFRGMPLPGVLDSHRAGDFGDTSLQSVKNYLADCPNTIIYYPGLFKVTAAAIESTPLAFAFAHVDCDLYESTRGALEFIWPRLSEGGIVLLDDYRSALCGGATKAIDDFAYENDCEIVGNSPREAAYIKKVSA